MQHLNHLLDNGPVINHWKKKNINTLTKLQIKFKAVDNKWNFINTKIIDKK